MSKIHVKLAYNRFCNQFDQAPWSFEDFCRFFETGRDSDLDYEDNQGRPWYDHAADAATYEAELQTFLVIKKFFNISVKAQGLGFFEFKRGFDKKIARYKKALQLVKFSDTEEEMWRQL